MSQLISASVGKGQKNFPGDVKIVQCLLNRTSVAAVAGSVFEDGRFGTKTEAAIIAFQRTAIGMSEPDGIVSRNGVTIRLLNSHLRQANASVPKTASADAGGLAESDFVDGAKTLQCEVAAIKAVASTETKRSAFDKQGRPTILFERHYFHKLTKGIFDVKYPDISNKSAGGYGNFSEQYYKLKRAMELDHTAALESASWGAFQIMGANYDAAGYSSVDDFVSAMNASEKNHLLAFVAFVKNSAGLLKALQKKDWAHFARIYNGPKYKKNNYDTIMKHNYEAARKDDTKSTVQTH